MVIYLDIKNHQWLYYLLDFDGYKHIVEGFSSQSDAESHANARFGEDIEFIFIQ